MECEKCNGVGVITTGEGETSPCGHCDNPDPRYSDTELQRSATPEELRLERLIDAIYRLDGRAAQIADAISDLEHTIAGATVAIVAGILCTREGYEFDGAVADARRIIEEVGNGE